MAGLVAPSPPFPPLFHPFPGRIVQGGKTFSLPLFDEGLYCRWVGSPDRRAEGLKGSNAQALQSSTVFTKPRNPLQARGVLMVSTVNFTEGEYLFEATSR